MIAFLLIAICILALFYLTPWRDSRVNTYRKIKEESQQTIAVVHAPPKKKYSALTTI